MTLAVFFGCTFIAFGPALGLFLFTIAHDPLRIIILIAGSVPLQRRRAGTSAIAATGVGVIGAVVQVPLLV